MTHLDFVLWAGLAIGLAFGACGQLSGFCLHRGLDQRWSGGDAPKLRSFAMALAVAILGTQALAATGGVDLSKSLYLTASVSWLLLPVGGLMFGYGMALANGCGARCLVLLGQGNLRSLMVLLCLGIAAYMTLTGVLSPLRVALAEITTYRLPAATIPAGVSRSVAACLVSVALLRYALRRLGSGLPVRDLACGVIVGLLVVAGWYTTGTLGADDFEPVPVTSLTFVAPIGDTLQYTMIASGMSLRFGVVVVLGVVLGSLLMAVSRGKYRLEGFETPEQMLRYMAGGVLMGAGGALALGCSIGQALTGLSTLSYSSAVAALSIVAGAWIGRHKGAARPTARVKSVSL